MTHKMEGIEHGHHHHEQVSIVGEFLCHLPYAIFSVAFCLIALSVVDYLSLSQGFSVALKNKGLDTLFHSFHFLHLVFAATGTLITFLRYSKSVWRAILIGLVVPPFFCVLSDVILPYYAGLLLGVQMDLHVCFYSELLNVVPFWFVGIVNGFAMSRHHSSLQSVYSLGSHFLHILVSALASSFYLTSHGLSNWYPKMGIVFLFLIVVVVIPCTLADVIVPIAYARGRIR